MSLGSSRGKGVENERR
jgi:hypothetical protein